MSIGILSRDFAFYGMLDLLQRALGVVLVPVYTRVLSQNDYGNLDLIITVSSAMLVLVDLQFLSGFSRFYLEHHRVGHGPRFSGTTVLTRAAMGVAVAGLFLLMGYSGLLEMRFMPSFVSNSTAWTLTAITIPLTLSYDILLMQTRMLRSKRWFAIGAIGNILLSSLLAVAFTVYIPLGIAGVVLGQFIGKLISTGLLFHGLRREISFCCHGDSFKELLRYTLPLVPGWWLGFSSAYVSRFFIFGERGASENAILSICTKLVAAIALYSGSFRTAWQPLAMSYIGDERSEEFYVRSLRLFLAGGILTAFSLTALSKPVLGILAPTSYGVAEIYVPLFIVATILSELEGNLQLGNQISKKTYWWSIGTAISFVVNMGMLITLTVRIGIDAAGLGLLCGSVIRTAITYFSAQRNYRIRYDIKSLLIFFVGCAALLMLSVASRENLVNRTAFISITALCGVLLPWFALAASERQAIRSLIARQIGRFLEKSPKQRT